MVKPLRADDLRERLNRSFKRIPPEDTPRLFRLKLAEIRPNPNQPRRHLDPQGLQELAASIERHGLIQPVTVKRLAEECYLLVAGERRFRAHELLKRDEILALVTSGNPDEVSLIENIQRQDLHPLEEAAAYARMMERHGWTQEQLADAVGKARPTITNSLKLNRLPDAIRAESLAAGGGSRSLLFEIARLDDPAAQTALWRSVQDGQATVRTVRAARTGPAAAAATTTAEALPATLAAGQRFLRRLQALAAGSDGTDGLGALEELRDAIDAELARLAADV